MTTIRQELQILEDQTRLSLRDLNDAERRIAINSDTIGAVLDLQRAAGRLLVISQRIANLAKELGEVA